MAKKKLKKRPVKASKQTRVASQPAESSAEAPASPTLPPKPLSPLPKWPSELASKKGTESTAKETLPPKDAKNGDGDTGAEEPKHTPLSKGVEEDKGTRAFAEEDLEEGLDDDEELSSEDDMLLSKHDTKMADLAKEATANREKKLALAKAVAAKEAEQAAAKAAELQKLQDAQEMAEAEVMSQRQQQEFQKVQLEVGAGTVKLTLHKAQDLKNVQAIGKQDPYVKFSFGKKQAKSRVHNNGGKNPVWGQSLSLSISESDVELNLEVWDANTVKDAFIGHINIPRASLLRQSTAVWYTIFGKGKNADKNRGEVLLAAEFFPAHIVSPIKVSPIKVSPQKPPQPQTPALPQKAQAEVLETPLPMKKMKKKKSPQDPNRMSPNRRYLTKVIKSMQGRMEHEQTQRENMRKRMKKRDLGSFCIKRTAAEKALTATQVALQSKFSELAQHEIDWNERLAGESDSTEEVPP